ncbi:MAG: hypothetical protein PHH77_05580 [Victivallaceae bacterium]|nr:hypothetical protein [Victivallaceae bacterium]
MTREKPAALPIVFIHRGSSSYLEFSLRQAKYANPGSEIILLGDAANDRFAFIKQVNIRDYFSRAAEFSEKYRHFSTNPYNYELFCFQRWFVLEEFMLAGKYGEVFVCDSDVLLYSDMNVLYDSLFRDRDFCLAVYSPEQASAGISYWKLASLTEFCRLLPEFFTDKARLSKITELWENNRRNGILGGFSDMTAVTEFIREYDRKRYANLLSVREGGTFDSHINTSTGADGEEYQYKRGKKVFSWEGRIPYCRKQDEKIRFHLIHFQGPAKYMMAFYYTGPKFKGKAALTLLYAGLNFMAFWYKTLKIRYRFAFLFRLLFKADLKRQ